MAETTPEKVPSVYHDASGSPRSPTDGTAAPKYETVEGTSTAATADEKAKVPTINSKQPALTEKEAVSSPVEITPQAGTSEPKSAHDRAATAESNMSQAAKEKLTQAELKEAKQMSKILKKEQKEQDQALKHLLKELSKLQTISKSAVRAESKATSKHSKAVKQEQKTHNKFATAKVKHEKAVAELHSRAERLTKEKEHASTQATLLQEKTKEVEEFRQKKALADRERQAKIQGLSQNPTGV